MNTQKILLISEIIVSIGLVLAILLQRQGSGLSGMLGGGGGGANPYKTRRGLEKILYVSTIVLAVVIFIITIALLKIS